MSPQTVVQVTLWKSAYLGNFMLSQLALARELRARLDLNTHFVLAPEAEGRAWLGDLDAAGMSWSIIPRDRSKWRAHLDEVIGERDTALLHTHFTAADLQGAGAAAAAGVPCVWHIRTGFNGYPLLRRAKDLIKLRLIARRRVARIITVSPWLSEFARRRGAPAERIETLPDAIALERFSRMPSGASARERFGLDPDAEVVLCLGWWPEVKGVDLLMQAVQLLAGAHPRLAVLLVGEEPMSSYLAEHVPQLPSWLHETGFVDDSAWLFAAADIFVSASRHEGQSTAVGEALACGLPVVMSDIPGTAGWGGAPKVLSFPSEDAGALAARLEQLLDEPREERDAAAARNRDWLLDHCTIEDWCERMCAIYAELLPGPSRRDAPSYDAT